MQSVLGKTIKALRKKAGFTQKNLGEKAGTTSNNISWIENKGTIPSVVVVQKIADALGTTVEYLLGVEDVSVTSASDTAFIRKYKRMDKASKEKIRKMCEIL